MQTVDLAGQFFQHVDQVMTQAKRLHHIERMYTYTYCSLRCE